MIEFPVPRSRGPLVQLGRRLFAPGRRWNGRADVIAVVKIGAIGDVLMTTPFLTALRRRFPASRIVYFVGGWSQGAVLHNPNVDEVVTLDDRGLWRMRPAAVLDAWNKLRRARADLGFVLDRHFLYSVLAAASGIRFRVGFDRAGEGFACNLTVPFGEPRHEVEYNLETLRLLTGEPVTQSPMTICPTTDEQRWAGEQWASWGLAGPVVAIMPGGATNPRQNATLKRWPLEHYAALIARLLATYPGLRVLLLGGDDDRELIAGLAGSNPARVVNAAGAGNLRQSAALLARCRLAITHDSGPMHVAAASGIPVLSIFGPTDPRRYAPQSAGDTTLFRGDLPGALCYTSFGSYPATTAALECLSAITPADVLDCVAQRYAQRLQEKPHPDPGGGVSTRSRP